MWVAEYLKDAREDIKKLDNSQRISVFKEINKVDHYGLKSIFRVKKF